MSMIVCIPQPLYELEVNHWDYLFNTFLVDRIYVVGDKLPKTKVLGNATLIRSYKELPQDETHVLLAPPNGEYVSGNESLKDFQHPTDCIYIVGANDALLNLSEFEKEPEHLVFIEGDDVADLYNYLALGITLYDRKVKSNG